VRAGQPHHDVYSVLPSADSISTHCGNIAVCPSLTSHIRRRATEPSLHISEISPSRLHSLIHHHHGRSIQPVHFILNAHAGRGRLLSARGAASFSAAARLSTSAAIWQRRTTSKSKLRICSASKHKSESLSPRPGALSRRRTGEKLHTRRATRLPRSGHHFRDATQT
jgi:hypothetical protein